MSNTSRSKKLLESRGYTVAIVERWNPHARIRQDLYGFIDLLGVKPDKTLAVQTTSRDHISSRRAKILESDKYYPVKSAGWNIEVHGWYKVGRLWQVKIVML